MPVIPTHSPYTSRRTAQNDFDMILQKTEIIMSNQLRFSAFCIRGASQR
jgi:hypothetical protein